MQQARPTHVVIQLGEALFCAADLPEKPAQFCFVINQLTLPL